MTLTDAASDFAPIDATVRYRDLAGDVIDQAILGHLQAAGPDRVGGTPDESSTRRRDACRRAKEYLTTATATVVPAELPGSGQGIRLSRTDLENLIAGPLEGFLTTVEETLRGNGVPASRLAAVAAVGGGAGIPLIGQRLSQRLRVPIVAAPKPMLSAAIGAAALAGREASADAATDVTRRAGADAATTAPTRVPTRMARPRLLTTGRAPPPRPGWTPTSTI